MGTGLARTGGEGGGGEGARTLLGVLGLDERCTNAEIRAAYRRLCLVHHPDKLAKAADAEQTAQTEARFRAIQAAYERLVGADLSAGEANAAETQATTIAGEVRGTRRHGKRLSYAYVLPADEGNVWVLVFNASTFDHAASAGEAAGSEFPSGKGDVAAGDRIRAVAVWRESPGQRRQLHVRCWRRERPEGAPPPPKPSHARHAAPRERREGASATAGWVRCPLCGDATNRRFHRGDGLEQHLDQRHASERDAASDAAAWHGEVAARADAEGIAPRRSAGRAGAHPEAEAADGAAGPPPRERAMSFAQSAGALALEEPGAVGASLEGRHPALVAARDGDCASLRALLAESGGFRLYDEASLDRHGASALDWAAGSGHLACVELLAPLAVGLNACRRDGRTALHWAARHGHTAVLTHLLSGAAGLGIDANRRTTNGTTMLMLACYGGHAEVCDALLAHGANLEARNAWGCDVGHFAAMGGHVAACVWAARRGVALDRPQRAGHTALHKAAELGRVDACRNLCAALSEAQREALRGDDAGGAAAEPTSSCGGGALTHEQRRARQKAGRPSAIARARGHAECAALLAEAGL